MTKLIENRFALTIVILFVSHTLFPAHEFNGPCGLCIEDKSFQQSCQDKQLKSLNHEQLTAELQQLVEATNDGAWRVNSSRMQELIRAGASANVTKNGNTLLCYVCAMNDIDFVKVCIAHGASLEGIDRIGETALYLCKSLPVLRCLLEAGADPNYENRWGKTVLHNSATQSRTIEVIEELCRHIVPFHRSWADTPLHNLCRMGVGKEDFERKLTVVLWWSELQLKIHNGQGKLPRDYLGEGEIVTFNAISGDIIRARAQLLQQQNKEKEELEQIVQQSIPVDVVVKLVFSYVEPPYISLRDFMVPEESKREYPAIAQAFWLPE